MKQINDNAVFKVCEYLRCGQPCERCDLRIKDQVYGRVVKGCRALAEETIKVVADAVSEYPEGDRHKIQPNSD